MECRDEAKKKKGCYVCLDTGRLWIIFFSGQFANLPQCATVCPSLLSFFFFCSFGHVPLSLTSLLYRRARFSAKIDITSAGAKEGGRAGLRVAVFVC